MVVKQMAKRKKEEANDPFSPKTESEILDELQKRQKKNYRI